MSGPLAPTRHSFGHPVSDLEASLLRGASLIRVRAFGSASSRRTQGPPAIPTGQKGPRKPSGRATLAQANHVGWSHPAVVLLGGHVARGERRGPQGEPLRVRLLGDRGRVVVADVW